jgi:hypothetical protein
VSIARGHCSVPEHESQLVLWVDAAGKASKVPIGRLEMDLGDVVDVAELGSLRFEWVEGWRKLDSMQYVQRECAYKSLRAELLSVSRDDLDAIPGVSNRNHWGIE